MGGVELHWIRIESVLDCLEDFIKASPIEESPKTHSARSSEALVAHLVAQPWVLAFAASEIAGLVGYGQMKSADVRRSGRGFHSLDSSNSFLGDDLLLEISKQTRQSRRLNEHDPMLLLL